MQEEDICFCQVLFDFISNKIASLITLPRVHDKSLMFEVKIDFEIVHQGIRRMFHEKKLLLVHLGMHSLIGQTEKLLSGSHQAIH